LTAFRPSLSSEQLCDQEADKQSCHYSYDGALSSPPLGDKV
jgi:hypothetical protein